MTYRTPFVSGKDSLHNEFRATLDDGGTKTIRIPGCILVTAMSVIPDVRRTMTSDFKRAGSKIVLVGTTKDELGGSVYYKSKGELGKNAPRVLKDSALATLNGVHRAIQAGCVLSAHDLSEGGVAAAATEMSIGGRLGADVQLASLIVEGNLDATKRMFSESQSRFLLEIPPDRLDDLKANLHEVPFAVIGEVRSDEQLAFTNNNEAIANLTIAEAEYAWKHPLDLDGTLTAEAKR
jgi:phosphoribosylformylglycinamidine synthase